MCTLILGLGVLGPGSLAVGANRDENPARPSDPPLRLSARPYVMGGRDRLAGGTWLAIRDARAVVALLNRRDSEAERAAKPGEAAAPPHAAPGPGGAPRADIRSRGLLALDVALADAGQAPERFLDAALSEAWRATREHRFAPFTLACLAPERGWMMSHVSGASSPVVHEVAPGWHVVTHVDPDDRDEPRTARLLDAIAGFAPRSAEEAEARLLELLGLHASDAGASARGDAVCLHAGPMVTVSTSLFTHAAGRARYLHLEGRPCTVPPRDLSALLSPAVHERAPS